MGYRQQLGGQPMYLPENRKEDCQTEKKKKKKKKIKKKKKKIKEKKERKEKKSVNVKSLIIINVWRVHSEKYILYYAL
jgi:hypothetical protein